MRLTIHTTVEKSYEEVFAGFTFDLFTKLTPKNPPVVVKRFDGCLTGDEVHIEMTLPVLNRTETWVSRIVRSGKVEGHSTYTDEYFFIDEGVELPFFLTFWRHTHRIIRNDSANAGSANAGSNDAGSGTVIVDDIEYRTPFWLAPFVAPVISAQFRARQPIYREYFAR